MKFRNKKKFRYGTPAHTGPSQALCAVLKRKEYLKIGRGIIWYLF